VVAQSILTPKLSWQSVGADLCASNPGVGSFRVVPEFSGDDTNYIMGFSYPENSSVYYRISNHKNISDALDDAENYSGHIIQVNKLNRKETPHSRLAPDELSPWGKIVHKTVFAQGVSFVSTSGHGGFRVFPHVQEAFPEHLRVSSGLGGLHWYEEDIESHKVVLAFPSLFTDREKAVADQSVRFFYPDIWEVHNLKRPVDQMSATFTMGNNHV
jgi:hypothetical protein